jgi:tetratricopeptide (TPR) repeat protein
MNIFQGLYPYEIMIMGLGALLFVVSLIALIIYLIQGKSIGGLVVFFLLSLGMLGYPRLKSVQYKDGIISMEFFEQQLQQHPEDLQARADLSRGLQAVQGRPADAKSSLIIAKAQWALGNEQAALASLQPAVREPSTNRDATALSQRIENVRQLEQLTAKAEQNRTAADKAELERQLSQVIREPVVSPQTAATVARAHAVLGQNEQAAKSAQKALTINPNLAAAPQLKAILQPH